MSDPADMRNHPRSYWPLPEHTHWLRDCFYQQRNRIGPGDFVIADRHLGDLLMVGGFLVVDVGQPPARDSDLAANQAALARALERDGRGMKSEIWCEMAEEDGYLELPEGTVFEPLLAGGISFSTKLSHIPIEIGVTKPETTARHFTYQRSLARWAYGSERLYVLAFDPARYVSPLDEMFRKIEAAEVTRRQQ